MGTGTGTVELQELGWNWFLDDEWPPRKRRCAKPAEFVWDEGYL